MYISSPLEPDCEDEDGMFGVNEVIRDGPVLDALGVTRDVPVPV